MFHKSNWQISSHNALFPSHSYMMMSNYTSSRLPTAIWVSIGIPALNVTKHAPWRQPFIISVSMGITELGEHFSELYWLERAQYKDAIRVWMTLILNDFFFILLKERLLSLITSLIWILLCWLKCQEKSLSNIHLHAKCFIYLILFNGLPFYYNISK